MVIVSWFCFTDGHYSVVAGLTAKKIFLQDPRKGGIRSLNLLDFERVWFDFDTDILKRKRDLKLRRIIVIKK